MNVWRRWNIYVISLEMLAQEVQQNFFYLLPTISRVRELPLLFL